MTREEVFEKKHYILELKTVKLNGRYIHSSICVKIEHPEQYG